MAVTGLTEALPAVAVTARRTASWRDYLTLTKPRIMSLLVLTAVCAMVAAAGGSPEAMPLAALGPLFDAPGVEFYSVQVGPRTADLRADGFGHIIDIAAEQKDFSDAAAIVANLDLMLTVDTSIGHLAGALGRACWLMLAFVPDWRWLLNRSDSPWYPSIRLFRQRTPGDWAGVVADVRAALIEAAAQAGR